MFLPLFFLLAGETALEAYPVAITINATFSPVAGQPDPLGLGPSGGTATIMTTVESALPNPNGYPVTVSLTVPVLFLNGSEATGTLFINSNGVITANFTNAQGTFSATVALIGVTFPTPAPTAFGTASFAAPASTVNYTALGATGTVGINGTVNAFGLTATPSTGISAAYTLGGSAPPGQSISVGSNDPAHPNLAYSAAIGPGTNGSSTGFLTLSSTGGTTPGTVTANFSTAVAVGTYTAAILINTTSDITGTPIMIPVTYTVTSGGGGGGGSGFQLSPGSLTFQFFTPATTVSSQTISVGSTGSALSYTAAVSSGSFLSVSPTSGTTPGTVTVSASASSLSLGTHTGAILFSAPGVPSVSVPVTVINGSPSPTPSLTAAPAALTFDYSQGGSLPAAQTVSVSSTDPVHFTAGSIAYYFTVSPSSATTNASISVGLNPAGLGVGTYSFTLVLTPDGGGATSVPVTVHVLEPTAVSLVATPASLSFVYPETSTAPLSQTVALTGDSPADFSIATSDAWLTAAPVSGTTDATLTITANPSGLAQGMYSGSVTVTEANTATPPLVIPVSFNLTETAPVTLTASPTAVAFAYQVGGAVPAAQTVSIASSSPTSTYTAAAIGGTWLVLALSSDAKTATLTVDPTNLMPGVYVGTLRISGSDFNNSPTFVPVTLTVAADPTLGFSPTSLTFNYQPGGTVPAPQTLAVAGSEAIPFTATTDVAWLAVLPVSGTAPGLLTLTSTPGGLANGTYRGHVLITGSGATTQTVSVPVTLNVNTVPVPAVSAITNGISYVNQIGAPGLIVSLWGQGLGPATPAPLELANATTVATSAGGTQVFADGIPCPILFASAQQVNAILPFSLEGKTSTDIQLQFQGVGSNTVSLPLEASNPGLFSVDSTGQGGGAILNQDLSINSASNPAAAGTIVAIFGGGGGQTNPTGMDGLIVPATMPFPAPVLPGSVTVAGQAAEMPYFGDAPGLVSGVLQFNVLIPPGTPSGPQPVVVTIGGAMTQPNLFVYVQ